MPNILFKCKNVMHLDGKKCICAKNIAEIRIKAILMKKQKGENKAMKKIGVTILKKMGEVTYRRAEKEANQVCPYFHYQEKLPPAVEKLSKLKNYDK